MTHFRNLNTFFLIRKSFCSLTLNILNIMLEITLRFSYSTTINYEDREET